MKVIHFTEGAAEPFESSQVCLTKFIPILHGTADTYVTCLHFLPGASVVELPTAQECALMIVFGTATILNFEPRCSIDLSPGVGVVVEEGEGYALQTSQGAIVIAVNAERLNVSKEPSPQLNASWAKLGQAERHTFRIMSTTSSSDISVTASQHYVERAAVLEFGLHSERWFTAAPLTTHSHSRKYDARLRSTPSSHIVRLSRTTITFI